MLKGEIVNRNSNKRRLAVLAALALAVLAGVVEASAAQKQIYDEQADARAQVAAAIDRASVSGKNVLLDFGANWCADCHALDAQMRSPELASLIERNYLVVHVDVGRFNKNLAVAREYGVPLEKGIPALAVLDPHGKLLYAQEQGQFEDARHLTRDAFKEFFERWRPRKHT